MNNNSSAGINVEIIEGIREEQTFTGTGLKLQGFDVITKKMTDHWKVEVYVNDEKWTQKDSLYDMNENEESYILKTGLTAGLTVVFGTGDFGKIPSNGSEIKVKYILSNGYAGNTNLTNVKMKFSESGISSKGEEVDLNEYMTISIVENASSGTDYEDINFTKMIAPKTSRSFVLATADNYRSYLMRYGEYSFIDVNVLKDGYLEDGGTVYITLLKDIDRYYSEGYDYFTVPESKMLPDADEIDNIKSLIEQSGYSVVNTSLVIDSLTIEHYIINIVIRTFESANKDSIRTSIYQYLDTYFKNIKRRDIIAKSDIISIVESISGVDTCNVFFISERNELAKINGYYTEYVREYDTESGICELKKNTVKVDTDIDPRIGFDEMNNLIIPDGVILIPRGGWSDSNGNSFAEVYNADTLSNLNIFFLDDVQSDIYTTDMDKKLTTLLKQIYQ